MTKRRTTKHRRPHIATMPLPELRSEDPLADARAEADRFRRDADIAAAQATTDADDARARRSVTEQEIAAVRETAAQILADAENEAALLRLRSTSDLQAARSELADLHERRALAEADLDQARQHAHTTRQDTAAYLTDHHAFANRLHQEAIEAATRLREAAHRDAQALREQAGADAARLRQAAEQTAAEADQLQQDGRADAIRVTSAAEQEARLVRYDAAVVRRQADAALERARQAASGGRARQWSDAVWRKAPWAALIAAVGLTASGEYELALLVGWPASVAALLPVTIDVWVVTAFHRGHDVKPALAVTVGTNAIYHLADRGMFGVDATGRPAWWLIILTASIAPIVVWRVHQLIGHEPAGSPTDQPGQIPVGSPAAAISEAPTALPAVAPSGPVGGRATASRRRTPKAPASAVVAGKSDAELVAAARARLAATGEVSATWLMTTHGIGATRAARIRNTATASTEDVA